MLSVEWMMTLPQCQDGVLRAPHCPNASCRVRLTVLGGLFPKI